MTQRAGHWLLNGWMLLLLFCVMLPFGWGLPPKEYLTLVEAAARVRWAFELGQQPTAWPCYLPCSQYVMVELKNTGESHVYKTFSLESIVNWKVSVGGRAACRSWLGTQA